MELFTHSLISECDPALTCLSDLRQYSKLQTGDKMMDGILRGIDPSAQQLSAAEGVCCRKFFTRGGIHFLRKKEVRGFAPHTTQHYPTLKCPAGSQFSSASDLSSAEQPVGVSTTRRRAMESELELAPSSTTAALSIRRRP